jgi:autotransporter translocation and assembly factor TamB
MKAVISKIKFLFSTTVCISILGSQTAFAAAPVGAITPKAPSPGTTVVPPTENSTRLPTDIYAEYFEARRTWSMQTLAKNEVQKFVTDQKKNIALELKISEGIVNVDGPKISEDGRICANYTVNRSNLPATNTGDIATTMEKYAQQINDKNESPVPDSIITATHFKTQAAENAPFMQLLYTCLTPNAF